MMFKITLNRTAPRPENFADVDEFFTAFAEWDSQKGTVVTFYEPWVEKKSERKSKYGTYAYNTTTKAKAYGKKAKEVLGPKKERKKAEPKKKEVVNEPAKQVHPVKAVSAPTKAEIKNTPHAGDTGVDDLLLLAGYKKTKDKMLIDQAKRRVETGISSLKQMVDEIDRKGLRDSFKDIYDDSKKSIDIAERVLASSASQVDANPPIQPEQTFTKATWENPNKPHLPVEVSKEVVTGPSGKKYRKTKEGVGVPAEEIREDDSPAEWSYENATKQIEANRDEYRHLLNEIEKNKLQDTYPEVYADTKKALEVAESLLAKNVQKIPQSDLAKLAKKVEPKKVDEAAKMKVGEEKNKTTKKEPEMIDENLLKAAVSPSGSLEFTEHPDYQLYRQSVDKARNAVIDRISRISDRFLQFADPTGDLGIEGSKVPASTVIEGFLNDAIRGKKLPNKGVFGDEAGSLIKIGNQAKSHNVTAKVKQRAKKLAKELGTPMIPVLAMNDADIPVGWALVQSPVSFPKGKDSFNTIPANAISSHKLSMYFDDMELPQDYKNGMMLNFDNDVDHGTWFLAKKYILSGKQLKPL